MKAAIPSLPCLNLVMLMGGIVVADDVDLLVVRRVFANQVEKTDPLLVTVLVHAGSNDAAIRCIHGRKERCGAVALVVMGHGLAATFLERKTGLGAIQRLNLALLVA